MSLPLPGTPGSPIPQNGNDWINAALSDLRTKVQQLQAISAGAKAVADLNANASTTLTLGGTTSGFTIPTTETQIYSGTITVPAGYTRVSVMNVAALTSSSASSGVNEWLRVRATINGTGSYVQGFLSSSVGGSGTAGTIRTFTGLTAGQTIAVGVNAWASSAVTATGGTLTNINAIAVFTR